MGKRNKKSKKAKTEILTVDSFDRQINMIESKKIQLFDSVVRSADPNILMKAQNFFNGHGEARNVTGAQIKSMLTDPLEFLTSFGYKEKPAQLTYQMLNNMSKTPVAAIILNTRAGQVQKFCQPQPDEYSVGFKIRMRNRRKELKKQNEVEIEALTNFVLYGGNNGPQWGRDDFETFIGKLVRDSLRYDQFCFEILENRRGVPQEFIATDSATYRIAVPDERSADPMKDPLTGQECLPYFVQIYQDAIENEFYPWELAFGIRRPRTDLLVHGYGYSELEELVNVVTSMLWSDEYNRRFFKQGSAPKGLLKIGGNIGEQSLKEFKRDWKAQMSGVYNSWKTPILDADKMEWVDLHRSNRDMEYSAWQEYLIKLHCALYLIDPSEIGFDIQRSQGSSSMFESNNESRLKYSRDKGLSPILRSIEKKINRNIVWRLNPDYEFVFVGLNATTEEQALEMAIKEVSNFKKVDEIRSKFDLDPLKEDGGGDIILNTVWMQWYNNKQMMAQQQGDDFGEEEGDYEPLPEEQEEEMEPLPEGEFNKSLNPFVEDLKNFVGELK